jgi:hypothetical protein
MMKTKPKTDLFGFPLDKESIIVKRRVPRKRHRNVGKKFREQLDRLRLSTTAAE